MRAEAHLSPGPLKLTQCMAILRYLGRKHGLAPKTDEERVRTDQAAVQFLDIRNAFIRLCYGEDFVSLICWVRFASSSSIIVTGGAAP